MDQGKTDTMSAIYQILHDQLQGVSDETYASCGEYTDFVCDHPEHHLLPGVAHQDVTVKADTLARIALTSLALRDLLGVMLVFLPGAMKLLDDLFIHSIGPLYKTLTKEQMLAAYLAGANRTMTTEGVAGDPTKELTALGFSHSEIDKLLNLSNRPTS